MKGINIVCRQDVDVLDKSLPCIAVDAGLFYCLENKLNIEITIGDFDSLANKVIESYQGEIIKSVAEKDLSDLALAFNYLEGYKDPIYVYGALGKRMDHCLVNLKLCYYSRLPINLIDNYNQIYALDAGKHRISKNQFTYISLINFQDCHISLAGFKYPLDNYFLEVNDNLCLSNEITGDYGDIIVDTRILIMLTRDNSQ